MYRICMALDTRATDGASNRVAAARDTVKHLKGVKVKLACILTACQTHYFPALYSAQFSLIHVQRPADRGIIRTYSTMETK
jgi:hypothetical protein